MKTASIVLLAIFTAVASIDGFYFHLYRYRLYARAASIREHWLHTINAVLFPVSVAPLFWGQATGAWLWLGLAANLLTFAIESADVATERASRADLGGLTPLEYWMHFAMSGLRWASASLALASIPPAAWTTPSMWTIDWTPTWQTGLVAGVVLLGVPVAILHVYLGVRRSPVVSA